MDESKIREHLEEANQHVKKGDDLIEQQEKRVQEMARDGHQTQIHKQYLEILREVKETFERNRDSIRDEVEGSREE
ncbi:MAG: hypothetical protein JO025_01950 [Verrucomicrobia bacterium]|nr:hypothetical protein [Verrucomicrobiota bacterium]